MIHVVFRGAPNDSKERKSPQCPAVGRDDWTRKFHFHPVACIATPYSTLPQRKGLHGGFPAAQFPPHFMDLTRTAYGTWSGGRFMHFGEPLDDERFLALIRPGDGIDTVLTADTYGQGEADRLLGRALEGVDRDAFSLVG